MHKKNYTAVWSETVQDLWGCFYLTLFFCFFSKKPLFLLLFRGMLLQGNEKNQLKEKKQ